MVIDGGGRCCSVSYSRGNYKVIRIAAVKAATRVFKSDR